MNYESVVAPILREVRPMLLPHYGNIDAFTYKEAERTEIAASVLTELDEKIEVFLRDRLRVTFPDISFVGEETGGDRTKDCFWLCDPIDGTAHFIRGMPFCTTMIALVENGEVVFGAIYDFVNDVLYMAEKGKGATMNGKPIHVSNRPLSNSYLGWESHVDKKENLERFLKLREKTILFKAVVAGFELAMIASGKLDGRVTFDPYMRDYDCAPGQLLVLEAGGIVRNLYKSTYDYRNLDCIATNPIIFKELTEGSDAIFPIKP